MTKERLLGPEIIGFQGSSMNQNNIIKVNSICLPKGLQDKTTSSIAPTHSLDTLVASMVSGEIRWGDYMMGLTVGNRVAIA